MRHRELLANQELRMQSHKVFSVFGHLIKRLCVKMQLQVEMKQRKIEKRFRQIILLHSCYFLRNYNLRKFSYKLFYSTETPLTVRKIRENANVAE